MGKASKREKSRSRTRERSRSRLKTPKSKMRKKSKRSTSRGGSREPKVQPSFEEPEASLRLGKSPNARRQRSGSRGRQAEPSAAKAEVPGQVKGKKGPSSTQKCPKSGKRKLQAKTPISGKRKSHKKEKTVQYHQQTFKPSKQFIIDVNNNRVGSNTMLSKPVILTQPPKRRGPKRNKAFDCSKSAAPMPGEMDAGEVSCLKVIPENLEQSIHEPVVKNVDDFDSPQKSVASMSSLINISAVDFKKYNPWAKDPAKKENQPKRKRRKKSIAFSKAPFIPGSSQPLLDSDNFSVMIEQQSLESSYLNKTNLKQESKVGLAPESDEGKESEVLDGNTCF